MRKPKKRPALYVASPLGFSQASRGFYNRELLPLIKRAGFRPIDPWKLTAKKTVVGVARMRYGPKKRAAWRKLNLVMGENNRQGIDRAVGVIAVLDGVDVDSGTASEIGYAFGTGKAIVGYRGDFRLAADNEGSTVNLQVEYWIRARGGKIVTSIKALPPVLRAVFRQR